MDLRFRNVSVKPDIYGQFINKDICLSRTPGGQGGRTIIWGSLQDLRLRQKNCNGWKENKTTTKTTLVTSTPQPMVNRPVDGMKRSTMGRSSQKRLLTGRKMSNL